MRPFAKARLRRQMTKRAALNKTVNDEVKKALSLTEDQSKRFDQIALQQRGLLAFADPSVAAKLKLSDDQKSKDPGDQPGELRRESRRLQQGCQRRGKDGSPQEDGRRSKREPGQAPGVLTDDQKKAWKEMTGEVIEVQIPRRPNN